VSFYAMFREFNYWEVSAHAGAEAARARIWPWRVGCGTVGGTILSALLPSGDPQPIPGAVDAGERLYLDGPDGRRIELISVGEATGWYRTDTEGNVVPDDFLIEGAWRLRSTGGGELPAFKTTFPVPPGIRAETPEVVTRATGVEIEWETAGRAEQEWMSIWVAAYEEAVEGSSMRSFEGVVCGAPATAGSLAIPSGVVSGMRATEDGFVLLEVLPETRFRSTFAIPGMDHAGFKQAPRLTRPVEIR
jgi:hypothetical protein